ncbi:MAG: KH domain-containing protein, partial [Thermodesulfobacteriota bacterium]
KLFQMEVPEIYEGIVEIKGAAREPGDRAKIAVASNTSDVDPVGACVGVKGSRVQTVVQELKGEKIDIVHWSDEPAIFVKNTLSPAQISRVIVDEDEHAMEVIVPDDQLSLAIGKKGQNVRLAAKLTGWKIDINTESVARGEAAEEMTPDEALRKAVEAAEAAEAAEALAESGTETGKETAAETEAETEAEAGKETGASDEEVPPPGFAGVSPDVISALHEAGFTTPESMAGLTAEELLGIEGVDDETAARLLEAVGAAAGAEVVEEEEEAPGEDTEAEAESEAAEEDDAGVEAEKEG